MERSGFHSLVSLLDVPYQNVGLVVRRSRLDELAGRMPSLLRAVRQGIERYYADKPFAMKVIGKYTKTSNAEDLENSYQTFRSAWEQNPAVPAAAVQTMLNFATHPAAKSAKPEALIDNSVLAEIAKSGFIDKLYK